MSETDTEPRTVATGTARERAYSALRAGILDGTFAAGTFVEETQICDLAKVSRTPVREALNRLAVEGLIDMLPRRGAMVRTVTAQELDELYDVRRMIEGRAAQQICREGHGAPEAMRALHAAMCAGPPGDHARHVELNRQFHHALVERTGNRVLTRIFADLHTSVVRVALTALAIDAARQATIHAEHGALIEALDARDADAATQILNRHLNPISEVTAKLPR